MLLRKNKGSMCVHSIRQSLGEEQDPWPAAASPALSYPGQKESCGSGQRELRGAHL